MLIPPSYKKFMLNNMFFKKPLSDYPIEKLYLSPANMRYIRSQILFLLRDENHAQTIECRFPEARKRVIAELTIDKLQPLEEMFLQKRFWEFSAKTYPVLDLHEINKQVILGATQMILEDPSLFSLDYERNFEKTRDYEYSEYSFRGGKWHPEDLIFDSAHNRKNPYFKQFDIWLDLSPDGRGPGNRYKYDLEQTKYDKRGYKFTPSKRQGQIPFWQIANARHYEDPTEGFRFENDRRVQDTRMTFSLQNNRKNFGSYYPNYPISNNYDCEAVPLIAPPTL